VGVREHQRRRSIEDHKVGRLRNVLEADHAGIGVEHFKRIGWRGALVMICKPGTLVSCNASSSVP
jgi:hypothetical protein